jgi:type I restriction enzyme S subunit
LDARKSGTTSVFAIYQKALMELPVPLPPVDRQRQYESILEVLSKQKLVARRGAREGEGLFLALQTRAFHGDL